MGEDLAMIYVFADCELDEDLYQLQRCGEVVAIEPQVFKLLIWIQKSSCKVF